MTEIDRLTADWVPDLARFLQGNVAAVAFVSQVCAIAHVWDDLIDRDGAVAEADIHGAFWLALIELPRNEFFREHSAELNPVMRLVALNWMAATKMEREGRDREITYVLRSAYIDLLTTAAALVGGPDWAAELTPEIRRWAHGETFEQYLQNIKIEEEARRELL
jgi:hypothetical protein